jgi:hypothetical protein
MHAVFAGLAFILVVFVATPLASAAYTRGLIGIFSPNNRRNTWAAALLAVVAMMAAGALFGRSRWLWPLDFFIDVASLRFVFNLSWSKALIVAVVGGVVGVIMMVLAFALFGTTIVLWLRTLNIRIE